MGYRHVTAMLQETIAFLACRPGGIYVDGTLGGAGHAAAICQAIMPSGKLIGVDRDADAVTNAEKVLASYATSIHLVHGDFLHLPDYLTQLNVDAVDGIVLDLGLSLYQLEASGRGFSFQKNEPLDMRMDTRSETRAYDLINHLDADQLAHIFKIYGEERWAKRIADTVVAARDQHPIQTTRQLTQLVSSAIPGRAAARQKIHPATRVFMALRIAVNQELDKLAAFLGFAPDLLKAGGRLCVLAFHSLEDRLVKHRFKELAQGCTCPSQLPQCVCHNRPKVRLLTRKVARPTEAEIALNPMARSTRLRAVEKLPS